jgi:hypothetical protein
MPETAVDKDRQLELGEVEAGFVKNRLMRLANSEFEAN